MTEPPDFQFDAAQRRKRSFNLFEGASTRQPVA
jgi:hypothetical protein